LRRWRQRCLVDRRVGAPSPKRAPADELERMRALYQQDYQGFTIKPFHEKLEQHHNYKLGYTTTRIYLQKTGVVPPAPRRGAQSAQAPAPADAVRSHGVLDVLEEACRRPKPA
jgi:hypothetical protein